MIKIIVLGYGSKFNKGDAALLNSRIAVLKKYVPNSTFTVFTYHPEIDYTQSGVKMLGSLGHVSKSPLKIMNNLFLVLRCCLLHFSEKYLSTDSQWLLGNNEGLKEYYNANVFITTGGDVFTEDYGLLSLSNYLFNIFLGLLLHKPIVIYGETMGPFKSKLGCYLARNIFKRVDLITVRDDISKENLINLGINKIPIHVTADSAFVLQSASTRKADEILIKEGIKINGGPIVGLSVSKLIARFNLEVQSQEAKYEAYTSFMARIIDYINERLNAVVIFVPHVVEPWGNDDRTVANDILRKVKIIGNNIAINSDYTPEELKSIIMKCDLFIGARMHACIASTSMCIPTIAIAYSQKVYGIIGKMLGQEKWIYDISHMDFKSLAQKIDEAWACRELITKDLQSRIAQVNERVWMNGKLVQELLNSSYQRSPNT